LRKDRFPCASPRSFSLVWQKLKEQKSQPVTPKITPEILTVLEVSRYLKVHPITVYRLLRQGRIPAFRVAGSWRFTMKDLERWIDSQKLPETRKRDGH